MKQLYNWNTLFQFTAKFPHAEVEFCSFSYYFAFPIHYLNLEMFVLRVAFRSCNFYVLKWIKTEVYFQGLLHDLKDVFEAFILCLSLEILPFFQFTEQQKCVPTAVWKEQEVSTRCYCLPLKHSLASPTWKFGAFHTSHNVKTEGTSVLDGLPASSAVCFCMCPLVSGMYPALTKEIGLCWSLVVTYGSCAWTMEKLTVYFLVRCPRAAQQILN